MAQITMKELIDAGLHFGHQTSRWNPKMAPFIYGKRNLVHIIDLKHTIRGLIRACHFLSRLAATGEQVLIVGTKRQIRPVVEAEAARCGMPYVAERWIGGTLTNFQTIRGRLHRLEELERMEAEGIIEQLSKKAQSRLRREMRKIRRNLEGIRGMSRPPGAVVVIDPRREEIAMQEAAKLNIPTVCLLDTDCDPDLVDIPIPGNDDAMRSVQVVLTRLVDSILEGRAALKEQAAMAERVEGQQPEQPARETAPARRGSEAVERLRRAAAAIRSPRRGGASRFAPRSGQRTEAVSLGGRDEATPAAKADAAEQAAPGEGAPGEAAPGEAAPGEGAEGHGKEGHGAEGGESPPAAPRGEDEKAS